MNQRFKNLVFILVLFLITMCSIPAFADDICGNVDIDFISKHLNNIPPQTLIASKSPVNGLCQVILNIGNRYFTVYASNEYVILGKMHKNKAILDSAELARLQKTNFIKAKAELDECVAIKYKPQGKIKNVVYMLTDPVCPYCNMATKNIQKFADDHNVELRMVFAGVRGAASDQKAIEAICRDFTLSEYAQEDWEKGDSKEYQCQKGKDLIEKSRSISSTLHIQGVPTFFLQDGTQIVGANIPRLERAVKESNANS